MHEKSQKLIRNAAETNIYTCEREYITFFLKWSKNTKEINYQVIHYTSLGVSLMKQRRTYGDDKS